MRRHVLDKVEAIIARYFDGRVSGHVVISREGSGYRADCSLHLSSGMNLQAEGAAQEPYASFEQALDKIERRLRRYKTRLKEHQAAAPTAAEGRARLQVANYVIEAPAEADEEPVDFNPVVVAEGSQPLKSLSVASAVAELDLSGAPLARVSARGKLSRERRLSPGRRRDRLARSALGRAASERGALAKSPHEVRPRRQVLTFEFEMSLTDLLTPDAIIPALRVNGKKQALQEMSERAALGVGAVGARNLRFAPPARAPRARPASATASPSRTASSPNAGAYSASSRGWSGRSISRRSTGSRST